MSLSPKNLQQYHVFLASPGDVSDEREHVRQFFDRYNRTIGQLWNTRFEVVDWENYSTIGVGRPQELITQQTLDRFKDSLALVIGLMAQRFGSPTGKAESGTEEEFNWAMDSHERTGFPEIKWFFRRIDKLELPTDPAQAIGAVEQWKKVLAFRNRMKDLNNPVFFSEYPGKESFRDVFENDLQRWLADPARPWIPANSVKTDVLSTTLLPPTKYYENIEREFRRLDIAGIDNDRAFEIPLSEIYVRLRVMFDEDAADENQPDETGPIDVQTALLRYPKLVIVGDPGSGKSTFLKYIALMLSRSFLTSNPSLALEKLCLPQPLPVPVFLSCWDLADFLRQKGPARLERLIEFMVDRLAASGFSILPDDMETLLNSGTCCLLFDGLDEVPTDQARAAVSRLLEEFIEKYGRNRFVVTSRIRAYTGDVILKGIFTRCDIQAFDSNDRAEFVRNWVALLFRVAPDAVVAEGSEAKREFTSLTRGIEEKDRIRELAINPLLLTVIAIVHWNRKRLPEQRIDLYDECVDVLLGQRKEAERAQRSRNLTSADEDHEQKSREERAWVRKRFAEIALHVLAQDGDRDEATKADVVTLLTPRFLDQGASNEEQARTRAELFLDRQELRSGLLVSRRALSYRFVHLTFQEYLAAWNLSNMDFDKVTEIIRSRLRLAKWFETLQLLGSAWAKESDEKANRYVAWLLENSGNAITEKAPVVALCANIVKDIRGIAELKPQTRRTFEEAVKATLAAFHGGAGQYGVPARTQLEILEALGQLGAAVKSHLIDATTASIFPVRRRAIEMLLPHLSDDELFGMIHILKDRSKEPVKTYIRAMIESDANRASKTLLSQASFRLAAVYAMIELSEWLRLKLSSVQLFELFITIAERGEVSYLADELAYEIARTPGGGNFRQRIEAVLVSKDHYKRRAVFDALAENWPDENSRKLLSACAVEDGAYLNRAAAMKTLVKRWPDDTTRELVTARAAQDEDSRLRQTAITLLVAKWPDENTQKILAERVGLDGFACSMVGGKHSEFGRILPTRDLDGRGPYLDPQKPFTLDHIAKAAKKLTIAEDQIDATVQSLSAHLGWDITLGSKPQ